MNCQAPPRYLGCHAREIVGTGGSGGQQQHPRTNWSWANFRATWSRRARDVESGAMAVGQDAASAATAAASGSSVDPTWSSRIACREFGPRLWLAGAPPDVSPGEHCPSTIEGLPLGGEL